MKISGGGEAQQQDDNMLIVAGSLPGDGEKDRSLRVPSGIEFIFVPAYNFLVTGADAKPFSGNPFRGGGSFGRSPMGPDDEYLIREVNRMTQSITARAQVRLSVGKQQTVYLLKPHVFSLDIQKAISGTDLNINMRDGTRTGSQKLPLTTKAASACHYAIIDVQDLKKGHRIVITGEIGSGRAIRVTYTVK